jgi:hypothetical protein
MVVVKFLQSIFETLNDSVYVLQELGDCGPFRSFPDNAVNEKGIPNMTPAFISLQVMKRVCCGDV